MISTIDGFNKWLEEKSKFGMKLGLERINMACELLGNPHLAFPTIHIGGTNGKGSTTSFIKSILVESGYKVGSFISPFVVEFNERISINDKYISDEDLIKYANILNPVVEKIGSMEYGSMTHFEIITLLSFIYFKDLNVDVVIYEVGLGGRYDSTNVIKPLASAITNIGYDHMNVLGDTLEQIAYEKAGIIKEDVPLITTEKNNEVLKVFESVCNLKNSGLVKVNDYNNVDLSIEGITFDYKDLNDIKIKLIGEYQVKNASLAIEIIKYLINKHSFNITNNNIVDGLRLASWPGRMEILNKAPLIIIDGAHNESGINGLLNTTDLLGINNATIIFGALKDKDTSTMINKLGTISKHIYFTTFNFYRADTGDNLSKKYNMKNFTVIEDWRKCVDSTIKSLNINDTLIITGSLYFISKVRKYLINNIIDK